MEAYNGWQKRRLTQSEAARILGVHERIFRRYIGRYEQEGTEGLYDKRISRASHRRAPVDEVMRMTEQYRTRYRDWNVRHYYGFYQQAGGRRSYTWVKNHLQAKGLAQKAQGRGKHRKRREPIAGCFHGVTFQFPFTVTSVISTHKALHLSGATRWLTLSVSFKSYTNKLPLGEGLFSRTAQLGKVISEFSTA